MFSHREGRARKKREPWQQNLFVLWFGTFIAGIAFSIMPFLSLYVNTLGNFSKSQLSLYSGLTYSSTFLVLAIISPIWERLLINEGVS